MPDGWHVALCVGSRVIDAVRAIAGLSCISEVCAPVATVTLTRRGRTLEVPRPWLGPMVLARWPGDDPYAWHAIMQLSPVYDILGGWLPATVPDTAVEAFLAKIKEHETKGWAALPPPCAAGDMVRFSHLNIFYRIIGRCVWVAADMVGIRLSILGRDATISVPFAGVEQVVRARRGVPQLGNNSKFPLYKPKKAA